MNNTPAVSAILALAALILVAQPVASQQPALWDSRSTEMSRDELQQVVQRLDAAAASPGYSEALRAQARREAELVRSRLEQGDFQVGDRVVLRVQGRQRFLDTLSVQPGRVIAVAEVGEISLVGVLRSELQAHLQSELGRFLQDPDVRAQTLIRIAVLGEVGSQGFYAVPAEALLEDALMIAGGPAGTADIDGIEIRRSDRVILGGEAVQQAIVEGRTLDQLNLRAGDRIYVPGTGGVFSGGIVRGLLTLTPTVILLITRIF